MRLLRFVHKSFESSSYCLQTVRKASLFLIMLVSSRDFYPCTMQMGLYLVLKFAPMTKFSFRDLHKVKGTFLLFIWLLKSYQEGFRVISNIKSSAMGRQCKPVLRSEEWAKHRREVKIMLANPTQGIFYSLWPSQYEGVLWRWCWEALVGSQSSTHGRVPFSVKHIASFSRPRFFLL